MRKLNSLIGCGKLQAKIFFLLKRAYIVNAGVFFFLKIMFLKYNFKLRLKKNLKGTKKNWEYVNHKRKIKLK